jgi:hypothetical protein
MYTYKINDSKLFNLLSNNLLVTNSEMENAYRNFVEQVIVTTQSERNYSEIYRILNITRIEFDSLDSSLLCELKKKIN